MSTEDDKRNRTLLAYKSSSLCIYSLKFQQNHRKLSILPPPRNRNDGPPTVSFPVVVCTTSTPISISASWGSSALASVPGYHRQARPAYAITIQTQKLNYTAIS
ncbi:hypothetical protein GWI33_009264 [Rhynchophorus ferrugineus]|uniref:Uncharacterized protein n=1 Tax=Rhynchophorus ferrugineus TaxID=354439 RepID=A0A834IEZ0_RHYFE|nr:hypothetical protein GWI33_009264 [Rhynchophorus ferrugineus]